MHVLLKVGAAETIDDVVQQRIVDEVPIEIEVHEDFLEILSFEKSGEVFLQESRVLMFDGGGEKHEGGAEFS